MKKSMFALACAVLVLSINGFGQEGEKDKEKGKEKKPAAEAPKVEKTDQAPKKTPPARIKGEPLDLPEVEGWLKSDLIKYPQRELGYSVNYDAEGGNRVSVYVYNNGRSDIRNSLGGAVKEELEAAKAGIDAMVEMGAYSDVKVIKDETTKLAGKEGKIEVLKKSLTFKTRGNDVTSEIIIFPFEGNFVKIRATRPKTLGPKAEEAVGKLYAELEAFFLMYINIAEAARTAVN